MNTSKQQQRSAGKLALCAVLAASAALGGSAQAAQATATASGTVIAPIAIVAATNLAFGSFFAGPGGTVTVSTSGARTASGVLLGAGGSPSAARFNITGQASATYAITHSGSAVLTNTTGAGGETMALTKFSDLNAGNVTAGEAATGVLDGAGAQSLYVGATLTVAASQVPGVYTGTVVATVEYN